MSTLVKRTRTWSANDAVATELSSEQDHEPQFGSVHDAQLELKHEAKSFDPKIHKVKVSFGVS